MIEIQPVWCRWRHNEDLALVPGCIGGPCSQRVAKVVVITRKAAHCSTAMFHTLSIEHRVGAILHNNGIR